LPLAGKTLLHSLCIRLKTRGKSCMHDQICVVINKGYYFF